jgi:hypothetical protein
MVERTILADIFRLLAELSMVHKRCDAAMAFLQKASQVGDPHTERQTKHAIRQLHGQHSVALQENPPERRQILFCTTDIPCWPPEGFCFASAATLRGTSWKFEAGHPQLNLFYVRHPLRPDQYYELEGFHDRVFEDKRQELVNLLKSIGATHVREEAFKRSLQERSVATGRVQEMRARIFGLGGFGAHTGESQVTEHRQVSQLETQEYDLYPTQPPQIPQDLVWYPHEAKWQSIAQDALSGSLKKVTVPLENREDFSINGKRAEQLAAGLDLFDYQEGVRWFHETEERLQQQMDTIWEFTASFGAVAALQ